MSNRARFCGQPSYLTDLLEEARKGGIDILPRTDDIVQTSQGQLTTEQWTGLENILATLTKCNGIKRQRQKEEFSLEMNPNLDINGNPNNHSGEPVFYRPRYTVPKNVAGIPYSVSDINHVCNQCTYRNKCARHSEPVWQKTDISLCNRNHVRMTLSWDITDPENRKGTWRFTIEPKYDRFDYPERERRKHEDAEAAKRDNRELSEGCCPVEPKWRMAELAKRIIEDHNDDQKDKVRRSFLNPKGYKYFIQKRDWGQKDPFTPTEGSRTRTSWEYSSADGSRVERELRSMLQAWYKAQLGKTRAGYDGSSEHAMQVWEAKMEATRIQREVAKSARGIVAVKKQVVKEAVKTEANRRHQMTTGVKTKFHSLGGTIAKTKEGQKPKPKTMSHKLTAAERRLLTQMAEAGKNDTYVDEPRVTEVVEDEDDSEDKSEENETTAKSERTMLSELPAGESQVTAISKKPTKSPVVQEKSADAEKHKTPLKEFVQKKSLSKTLKPNKKEEKRKPPSTHYDSQPPLKKTRSKYKSADIIVDSDEEADYVLPTAPTLELPKQREGWKLDGRLGNEVKEAIQVMQTDKVLTTSADFIVEQGTTIVKKMVKAKKRECSVAVEPETVVATKEQNKAFQIEEDASPASSQATPPLLTLSLTPSAPLEEVEEKIPTPSTPQFCSEPTPRLHKRKASSSDSTDEEDGVVAKKAKKVRFSVE
jgi:hypothetical protein